MLSGGLILIVGVLLLLGRVLGATVNRWIAGTSYGDLGRIEVVGTSRVIPLDVKKAARISPQMDLMTISLDSVAARVATLPGVKSAKAYRRLPGKLVIQVEERSPVAAAMVKGEMILMDEEGRTFKREHLGEVVDLPFITGNIIRNGRIMRSPLDLILKLRDEFPTVFQHLGEVNVGNGKIALRLRDSGADVRFKEPLTREALADLEIFLQQRGDQLPADLRYVDLRFPTMVVAGTQQNSDVKGN